MTPNTPFFAACPQCQWPLREQVTQCPSCFSPISLPLARARTLRQGLQVYVALVAVIILVMSGVLFLHPFSGPKPVGVLAATRTPRPTAFLDTPSSDPSLASPASGGGVSPSPTLPPSLSGGGGAPPSSPGGVSPPPTSPPSSSGGGGAPPPTSTPASGGGGLPPPNSPPATATPTPVSPQSVCVNLFGSFNLVGVGPGSNLDGFGNGYNGASWPSTITAGGQTCPLGAAGAPDLLVPSEQVFAVSGAYHTVTFVGAGFGGGQGGVFCVYYTVGSDQCLGRDLTDWQQTTPQYGDGLVRIFTRSQTQTAPTALFSVTMTLDSGRQLATIKLPVQPNMVLAAITLTP